MEQMTKTNYDAIKDFSLEEMATFISLAEDPEKYVNYYHDNLEWLKEEEDHDKTLRKAIYKLFNKEMISNSEEK